MADIYGLFADPEEQARQKAAAMADALRGQKGFGQLGMLTGDRVLGAFGQQQMADVGRQEGFIAQAGQQRGQQNFSAGQADIDRQAAGARFREQLSAQRAAKEQDAAAEKSKEARSIEEGLRKEFSGNAAYKQAQSAIASLRQVQSAAPDGVGDLQRIFAYVNLIDPGSVVRQEDMANIAKTSGLPGIAQSAFQQLTAQGSLPPEARAALDRSAATIAEQRLKSAKETETFYRRLASESNVDPERVALPLGVDLGFSAGASSATPAQMGRAPAAAAAPARPTSVSPQDAAALKWATSNPNDPRSSKILERLRAKGVQ